MVESIRKRVAEALEALGAPGRLAVACSGGPDSVVLADAVMALHRRGRLGPSVLIHVDHRLRPGSADEGALVEYLASDGGARAVRVRAEVSGVGPSLEDRARRARYAALDAAADEAGAGAVLLAHTASDQAETVLMRVIRGSGVHGLAGIPRRRGRYLRPLLDVTRAEIEAYLAERGLPAVRDPMNADPAFFRSRVRHRWLPALRAENPRLDEALCRLAQSAAEQGDAIDEAARALVREPLACAALAGAPVAVAKRALVAAADAAGVGPLRGRHLDALHELVARPEAGSVAVDIPGGTAVREYDILRFAAGDERRPLPGDVRAEGAEGPYTVRGWRPGDRMRPERLGGHSRKLSDLYGDAKVPRSRRARARVVTRAGDGAIVWAEHIGPAHGAKVRITLTPHEPVASNKVTEEQ